METICTNVLTPFTEAQKATILKDIEKVRGFLAKEMAYREDLRNQKMIDIHQAYIDKMTAMLPIGWMKPVFTYA